MRGILAFCSEVTFKILDKGLLETFGPLGLSQSLLHLSQNAVKLTSGYIFHYAFLLVLGILSLLLLNFYLIDTINFEF